MLTHARTPETYDDSRGRCKAEPSRFCLLCIDLSIWRARRRYVEAAGPPGGWVVSCCKISITLIEG